MDLDFRSGRCLFEDDKENVMLQNFGLYCITDRDGGMDVVFQTEAMIRGGARIIQYRDKKASDEEFRAVAVRLRKMTREAGVVFIVNDRVSIAKEVGADGVHLGQEDVSVEEALGILNGKFLIRNNHWGDFSAKDDKRCCIIGKSTHGLEQALAAEKEGASYIGVGPVFATLTKPEYSPIGLDIVREVLKCVKIPVVAIGGITLDNLNEVLRTGVKNVAMITGVTRARDIEERVREVSFKYFHEHS